MAQVRFVVEEAGCPSCAARLRTALAPVATVEEIEIDETADLAAVTLSADGELGVEQIAHALDQASDGSGHTYRLRAGSWQA